MPSGDGLVDDNIVVNLYSSSVQPGIPIQVYRYSFEITGHKTVYLLVAVAAVYQYPLADSHVNPCP